MSVTVRKNIKTLKKYMVYGFTKSGSFDRLDKKRLKPLTRLRNSMDEIDLENNNSLNLRVQDWYNDIEIGHR